MWDDYSKHGGLVAISIEDNKIRCNLTETVNVILKPFYVGGTLQTVLKLKQDVFELHKRNENISIIWK